VNAARYRRLLDAAVARLNGVVRSVLGRSGVPVDERQRAEVALQLLRPVQEARLDTFAVAAQHVRDEGVSVLLPSLPREYQLGAPISVITSATDSQNVTPSSSSDLIVVRTVTDQVIRGLQRHAEQPARDLVADVAELEPNGAWARVLTGPNSCSFCAMLASRGPVYESRETALIDRVRLDTYHNGCDCIAVFVPGGLRNTTWEGREQWGRLIRAWRRSQPGGDFRREGDQRRASRNVFRSWWEREVREGRGSDYLPQSLQPERSTPTPDDQQAAPPAPPQPPAPPTVVGGSPADDDGWIVPNVTAIAERPRREAVPRDRPTVTDLIDRELIAPDSDPFRGFNADERAAAEWLSDNNVRGVRAVARRLGEREVTPDAVFDSADGTRTLEIKTLNSPTVNAVHRNIRSAARQASIIVIDGRAAGISRAQAEAGLANGVRSEGSDIEQVIVVLGDGSAIGWRP